MKYYVTDAPDELDMRSTLSLVEDDFLFGGPGWRLVGVEEPEQIDKYHGAGHSTMLHYCQPCVERWAENTGRKRLR